MANNGHWRIGEIWRAIARRHTFIQFGKGVKILVRLTGGNITVSGRLRPGYGPFATVIGAQIYGGPKYMLLNTVSPLILATALGWAVRIDSCNITHRNFRLIAQRKGGRTTGNIDV